MGSAATGNVDSMIHEPGSDRRLRRLFVSGYPLVLVLIGASYWFTAAQATEDPGAVALLIQLVTVAVVFYTARVHRSVQHVSWWVLGAGVVAILVVLIGGYTNQALDAVLATAATVAYMVAPVVIVSAESRRSRVDGQTLLAAVCAYILIGMFFTYLYNSVALWSAASVFDGGQPDGLTHLLFFSFTTLTTTGYGNLVPAGAGMQSIAIAEAITGQLFLVIAVARVVTGWKPNPPNPRS